MSSSLYVPSFRKKHHSKSAAQDFPYQLYENVKLLQVKPNKENHTHEDVSIKFSTYYEGTERSLLALVCSNGHLLLILREGEKKKTVVKQLNWFQNKSKSATAVCIDPLKGAWLLCACVDSSVYLVPVLVHMKESLLNTNALTNSSITASTTDISRVQYARPLRGKPSSLTWWHTIDDQNVGIVGTTSGELVFLDLAQRQEIGRSCVTDKPIIDLELLQDIHERTSHLLIKIDNNRTLQLLLEQPTQTVVFTSSLTQGFDMGYDMVTDCNIESILALERKDNKEEINLNNRTEMLPQEFSYSIHQIRDNKWIAKLDKKFCALEVFSDIKRVPEFTYHVPQDMMNIALCNNLMFAIYRGIEKISMVLLSRYLSTIAYGRGLKKPDPIKRPDFQTFFLDDSRRLVACYKSRFSCPASWEQLFPHDRGYEEECELNAFLVVADDGVYECRPKVSPEHYFTELVMKDIDIAEKLGITFDLNMPLLFEFIGDKQMELKEISTAMKFYHFSKCSLLKRAVKIVEYGSVTDALIYIKQVLKKPPHVIASKDKKKLADMAIACYIEQVLEFQSSGNFSKKVSDSFRSFLCDNFDYDEIKTMELLASNGMIENLFEVGKARGKIEDALRLLSERGCFLLTSSIQNMLLDSGHAEKVCKACDGAFIKHMHPEEQVRFLLSQPEVTKQFIKKLSLLLPKLSEAPLLLIARVFDPSRQFIKQIFEKSDMFRRKRTGSSLSLISNSSSQTMEDPTIPTASDIILMFLKTLVALNSIRKEKSIPDIRLISKHLSDQISLTGSFHKRSDSLGSNEIMKSEVAQLRLACGRHHSAFVSSERDLYTWGKVSCGRLGHGDLMDENATSQPMRVESLHMHGIQVLSVSCGAMHTVALCQEGVFAWGSNKYGQLGIGDKRKRSRPVLLSDISSKYIISVVCGHYHTLAITTDQKLYAWGWGIHGQLGINSAENKVTPQYVSALKDHNVIQAAAGYAHSVVLTSRGLVFTFGAGLYGQLGVGTNLKCSVPQLVETLEEDSIYLVACGAFETLAVSEDQTIFCWGRNYHQYHICGKAENARYGRQMASNTTDINHRYFPEELPFKLQHHITQLVCGNWHYIALTAMNYVYTWGCNDCGQLGHYNKIDQPAPRLVKALSRKCVINIAAGSEYSVVIDADEQVLAWGRADGGLIGIDYEGSANTNPVARRSTYSILAPNIVQGLPLHFDDISTTSGHTNREYLFDQHYELPDLSSVGQGQPPYSNEAMLLALYKLNGIYNLHVIKEYSRHMEQWFILSFCCELKEEWDMAFTYRMRAIVHCMTSQDQELAKEQYCEKTVRVVDDLLKKFEDFFPEEIQVNSSLVAMVKCLVNVFEYWEKEEFPHGRLEEVLRRYVQSLSPLFAIVIFGFLADITKCKSPMMRFSLYHVTEQHVVCKHFSKVFYDDFLSNIIIQLDVKSTWYDFLSSSDINVGVDKKEGSSARSHSVTSIDESTLGRDEMVKEILEHKRKLLNTKSYLTLSNVFSTTLADASIAQKASMNGGKGIKRDNEPDLTVFSCSHKLLRCYMFETIIPEFASRMAQLPEPLTYTAEVMIRYFRQSDIKIPMPCPCCVYNSLRNEQMSVLRETGSDMINNMPTIWEI